MAAPHRSVITNWVEVAAPLVRTNAIDLPPTPWRLLSRKVAARPTVSGRRLTIGAVAAESVAKASPGGYALLMGTGSGNAVFPAVKRNLPFDPLRGFVAVSSFFVTPNILVVHPSVPAQNVAEFIALVRRILLPVPRLIGSDHVAGGETR